MLAALFFCSGAAALIVETTWLRWLRVLLGATAPAASATLVAFFSGNAVGAALAGRFAARWRRPLAVYGAIEIAAAGFALTTPLILWLGGTALAGVYDALRASPASLIPVRLVLALAATFPAAVCFGASFPALGAAAMADARALGTHGARLYGLNTLGAALGAALAAFWLPDWIGVRATYAAAAALLAAVGGIALALARRRIGTAAAVVPEPGGRPERPSRRPAPGDAGDSALVAIAALSGFGSFAAQVLLVQAFGLVLNQSVYAFGAVLVTVLLALALGAELTAQLARRDRLDPRTLLGAALALTALGLALFPALLAWATDGLRFVGTGRPWPAYLVSALGTAAVCAGPALLCAGLVFPLTFARAAREPAVGRAGAAAPLGRLLAANTVGALLGALAAPYLLLPAAGVFASFGWLALLYAVAALCIADVTSTRRAARAALLVAGGALVLITASPLNRAPVRLAPGETLLEALRSASGVVAVIERGGERLIRTDDHYVLGGTGEQVHEERQAHLPLLLHPRPERVAYVGSATGISAGAALLHPVRRLFVVELVPDVARAARAFFGAANRGVYDDARSEVVLDDARNFLRLTRARFDVVIADLFVPWRSGTGALYTREHFEAVRDRLLPGGLFCQWLPLYQLSRAEFDSI
ncbi:MAG: hypothetical protein JSU66_07595, partial [Deltaproteobacteria bacterium]